MSDVTTDVVSAIISALACSAILYGILYFAGEPVSAWIRRHNGRT